MPTLGSLFDGSGTFPLAAKICGIDPVWASEIEPFAIRVTTKRMPDVRHLGDVTHIHGGEIPPVDIITFGSPCQDLSLAGKRAGLQGGERSSLFFDAIRIIKEMRNATGNEYPRYAIWENVPGAFSSNGGRDFSAVLSSFVDIAGSRILCSHLFAQGRHTAAGCILAEGASISWRTLDAQYFGVPQRRRRIFLVADLGGERAAEILFEREGVRRNLKTGFQTWQEDTRRTAGSAGGTCLYPDIAGTLTARHDGSPRIGSTPDIVVFEGCGARPSHKGDGYSDAGVSYTLNGVERHGVAYAMSTVSFVDSGVNVSPSLIASMSRAPHVVAKPPEHIVRKFTPTECARLMGFPGDWCRELETPECDIADADITFWSEVFETHRHIMGGKRAKTEKQIRRWLEDPYSERAEYRLWGNGVALPCAVYVLRGIVEGAE
jgi:DNA (cytosine-5)-methyltransferase 1